MLRRASDAAGTPARALEIGAEGGRWSKLLSDDGWKMICTDVDPTALAICAKRLPDAECILVDPAATTLPCESASVKLILAYEVPAVVQSEWFPLEAARVLQPEGILVCSFHNRLSIRALVYKLLSLFDEQRRKYDYYRGGSYGAVRRKLAEYGVEPISEMGLGWFPFTRQSDSPLIPLCVRIEAFLGLRRLPRLSPFVLLMAERSR